MISAAKRAQASMFGIVAGAMLAPMPALAQDTAAQGTARAAPSSEIVVTAQRRAERSVDVPITVTTLGSEQLATANVNQLSDTARLTPGLRFDAQGSAVQPTIRGVGTAITTSGGGPNVATYVDGFFQPNTYSSDLQLLRVQSIQVLKGPQGTLFGRNTTGGAILVTTSDPSTDTSADVKLSYGRFNSLTAQAYATTGLTDRIAVDLEGLYRRGDGYFTDRLNNNDEVGKYENWSIRAGIKAELTDDVSVLVRYTHTDNDDPTNQLTNLYVDDSGSAGFLTMVSPAGRAIYGAQSSKGLPLGYFYAPPGTYATRPGDIRLDARIALRTKIDAVQGTIKADLGFADLTSYTQYRHETTPYYGDLDATALPLFGIFVGIKDKTFSQEFVVNSKPGSRLQWTAGLNYFHYRDDYIPVNASFGGAPFIRFGGSSTTTKSYAGFVDATYEVTDKLFLTAGARYSHDEVTDAFFISGPFLFSYTGVNGQQVPFNGGPNVNIPVPDLKNNRVTPRVVIRYKPDPDSSVYASFTKGYKAGILNVGGNSQQPIQPETINAYEAGYKYSSGGLSFDLSGYYYDYKNLQVSSFQSGAAQIRNAASSRIYGAEAQARYQVSNALSVFGGVAWTHARYRSFANAPYYSYCDPAAAVGTALGCVPPALGGSGPGAIVQTTSDASGFHMQRAPDFTANAGASYGVDVARGRLTLSGNLYYTSSFYFDPSEQFRQEPYAQLSLRAQWVDPSEHYTIAIYGDNVADKRYRTQVLFTTVGTGSVWNSPATYGVELRAKF